MTAAVIGAGWLVYANRWGLGHRAVRIADPVVRRWAEREVSRLSDGAYHLVSSRIVVNEAERSVSVDTIIVTTDLSVNARRKVPLPALTMRFRGCGLRGIDLVRLTAGRGLHVAAAGCDTVAVTAEVPRPEGAADTSDQGAFLRLRGDLDLPREVPFIRIDTVAFPQLSVALGVNRRSNRRYALQFDRLAVRLDSLHYDPREKQSARRTLLSRDVTLSLEGFEGSREAATRLALDRFSVGLANRTLRLEQFEYEPLPGPFADSLGFTALSVGRLALDDVDWRRFLTTGDIAVGRMTIDSATVQVSPTMDSIPKAEAVPRIRPQRPPLEVILRTIGRGVSLDTLALSRVTVIQNDLNSSFRTTTTVDTLMLANVAFSDDGESWNREHPVGPVTLAARGVLRRDSGGDRVALRTLSVDLAVGTAHATGLRAGPEGSDGDWVRRNRWRNDKVTVSAESIAVHGANVPNYLRRDRYDVRRADVHGFRFDIYSDKRLPPRGRRGTRRTPQQAMHDLGVTMAIDTIAIRGRMAYRERSAEAEAPGEIAWENLQVRVTNLSTDPARQTAANPMRIVADSRLMGAGPFHVEIAIPLLAPDFQMHYSGRLGTMPAKAFSPFLKGATQGAFSGGTIDEIRFSAQVRNGFASGTVAPRWTGLRVELPGIARSGPLGGIRRAIAKFAANEFVIRTDNPPGPGRPPEDGVIRLQWTPANSLPQFLWFSLRDGLMPIVKR